MLEKVNNYNDDKKVSETSALVYISQINVTRY